MKTNKTKSKRFFKNNRKPKSDKQNNFQADEQQEAKNSKAIAKKLKLNRKLTSIIKQQEKSNISEKGEKKLKKKLEKRKSVSFNKDADETFEIPSILQKAVLQTKINVQNEPNFKENINTTKDKTKKSKALNKKQRKLARIEKEKQAKARANDSEIPKVRNSDDIIPKKVKWTNKQRVMILCNNSIGFHHKQLVMDLRNTFPHRKIDNKFSDKESLSVLNEICETSNCNKCLYFISRKRRDFYLWMSCVPNGPSIKFEILNYHSMLSLKLTGNSLRGARPLLSFDSKFESSSHWRLMKEVINQIFNFPQGHPKTQPFYDKVYVFSILDQKIWFRTFQVVEEDGQLSEMGPRFVLNPLLILNGSFTGECIWANENYVPPAKFRQQLKMAKSTRYIDNLVEKHKLAQKLAEPRVDPDPTDKFFTTTSKHESKDKTSLRSLQGFYNEVEGEAIQQRREKREELQEATKKKKEKRKLAKDEANSKAKKRRLEIDENEEEDEKSMEDLLDRESYDELTDRNEEQNEDDESGFSEEDEVESGEAEEESGDENGELEEVENESGDEEGTEMEDEENSLEEKESEEESDDESRQEESDDESGQEESDDESGQEESDDESGQEESDDENGDNLTQGEDVDESDEEEGGASVAKSASDSEEDSWEDCSDESEQE